MSRPVPSADSLFDVAQGEVLKEKGGTNWLPLVDDRALIEIEASRWPLAGMGEAGTGGTAEAGPAAGGASVLVGAGGSTSVTDATEGCAGVATGGSGSDAKPAINAVAWLQPVSCERFVAYEVRDVRDQDGIPVTDYTCERTSSDGGVENTYAGNRSFAPGTFQGTLSCATPRQGDDHHHVGSRTGD